MNPEDLYDELVTQFPPLWPQSPEWSWVNVHDGKEPNVQAISGLLSKAFAAQDVIVLVHSTPGVAVQIPSVAAAQYVAQFVLKHEVQVTDLKFSRFVSVTSSGVATSDA